MVAEQLSLRIAGGTDAPGRARGALRRMRGELPVETLDVLTLLTSELVTNAVRHARANPIEIELSVRAHSIRVEVADQGPGFTSGRHPVAPDGHGGFGLFLVDELATSWGVYDRGGTRIWFELER
jgi:anti-sigma regulatory factor (Ser/Thr protein kinase)